MIFFDLISAVVWSSTFKVDNDLLLIVPALTILRQIRDWEELWKIKIGHYLLKCIIVGLVCKVLFYLVLTI